MKGPSLLDYFYLAERLPHRSGLGARSGRLSACVVPAFVRAAFDLRPGDRLGAKLHAAVVADLVPEWKEIPFFVSGSGAMPATRRARIWEKEEHAAEITQMIERGAGVAGDARSRPNQGDVGRGPRGRRLGRLRARLLPARMAGRLRGTPRALGRRRDGGAGANVMRAALYASTLIAAAALAGAGAQPGLAASDSLIRTLREQPCPNAGIPHRPRLQQAGRRPREARPLHPRGRQREAEAAAELVSEPCDEPRVPEATSRLSLGRDPDPGLPRGRSPGPARSPAGRYRLDRAQPPARQARPADGVVQPRRRHPGRVARLHHPGLRLRGDAAKGGGPDPARLDRDARRVPLSGAATSTRTTASSPTWGCSCWPIAMSPFFPQAAALGGDGARAVPADPRRAHERLGHLARALHRLPLPGDPDRGDVPRAQRLGPADRGHRRPAQRDRALVRRARRQATR